MMLVSLIGGGGDGGAGFWRKTSSKSSCNRSVEVWSTELNRVDSEIRSEDRWRRDGWDDEEVDDTVLPLSFLFGGASSWGWDRGDGETRLASSAECPSLVSKLLVLPLYMSFSVSSKMLASLKLRLVCLSVTRVSSKPVALMTALLPPSPSPVLVCGMPGKVMASRLARLSLSVPCHSVPPPSRVPGGEKGQGRPTEAAKEEVLWVRWRSLFLCRSLRVTGV